MKMPAKIFKMHAKTYEQESSKIFAENREDLGQNFWNIEKDKDKEKVGGRPAKLNEKKSHIQLEREIKKERGHYFFIGRTTWKFCSGGEKMRNASGGEKMRKFNATTSCKSTWDTVPHLCIDGLSMILCLWSPLHPLSKLLAIQDHTQNLEEQLWMGGRREVSIIFYRPVTRSDLKRERSFFRGSVSSFLQLVVARPNSRS